MLIPSNSLDNFLRFTFSDHLSISKIKIPKLHLKSGTPLRPLHFGHFCQFFRGFFHLLGNPLEVAQNFNFHQISWTILHVFTIIDHVSISKFSCPKMPSKSGTLNPFTHCGQSTLYSTDYRHFLCPESIISEIFVLHHAPRALSVPHGMPPSTASADLEPN